MDDMQLLRRFEPIVRYTEGEAFFPLAVDGYVSRAGLWIKPSRGEAELLAAPGALDLETLAASGEAPPGTTRYLNLVSEPPSGLTQQQWVYRRRSTFESAGRLARVPLVFRIADSFFDLSFLVRGEVPGGFAAAAEAAYADLHALDSRRVYYGRVVRAGGWIVCQYLFFFTMNDWRSSFFGMNDHEADWEQVFVYAYEDDHGDVLPRWAAYASHDFKGDDLRRRWDDPLLEKVDTHPVVYAGAGSHASYFEPGEYLIGIEPDFLRPVARVAEAGRRFWFEQLRMGSAPDGQTSETNWRPVLSVPHVDYARGDGKSIGPGQEEEWSPVLISDDVPWVDRYRGLWGLDTQDFIGGERAPSGPKYNRDGSVRLSWYDPLGWAGVEKVPTPREEGQELEKRLVALRAELAEVEAASERGAATVTALALDGAALRSSEYNTAFAEAKEELLVAQEEELRRLKGRAVEIRETIKALRSVQRRRQAGEWASPTAHLRSVHHPEPPPRPNQRIVDIWAAVSGAMGFVAVLLLLLIRPANWPWWLIGVIVGLSLIEALARRQLVSRLLTISIILAVIAVVILVVELWELLIVLGVLALAIFMVVENLGELRS